MRAICTSSVTVLFIENKEAEQKALVKMYEFMYFTKVVVPPILDGPVNIVLCK
jgi:ribosomal protein L25 (general stress protein Ctc)